MRLGRVVGIPVALVVALAGCGAEPAAPDTALVEVGDRRFEVEVARTAQEQQTGLAGRDGLAEGTGMFFDFTGRQERQVWMAGVRFPIDVAWIVDDRVSGVLTLEPCTRVDQAQCPRWTSPTAVEAMLEVPAGALGGVAEGTPVTVREADS